MLFCQLVEIWHVNITQSCKVFVKISRNQIFPKLNSNWFYSENTGQVSWIFEGIWSISKYFQRMGWTASKNICCWNHLYQKSSLVFVVVVVDLWFLSKCEKLIISSWKIYGKTVFLEQFRVDMEYFSKFMVYFTLTMFTVDLLRKNQETNIYINLNLITENTTITGDGGVTGLVHMFLPVEMVVSRYWCISFSPHHSTNKKA